MELLKNENSDTGGLKFKIRKISIRFYKNQQAVLRIRNISFI